MARKRRTTDAVEILHELFVQDDPKRKAALETERVHGDVAQMIYDLRTDAGLTQKELATLVGTKQPVISRLEHADYQGHSLAMLRRIARALRRGLAVAMTAQEPETCMLRHAFQLLLEKLRKAKGLTFEALAKKTGLDRRELVEVERSAGYRPSPRTLHILADYYDLPQRKLASLAGAFQNVEAGFTESASRFAAQSESFARLSKGEKKALDQFVNALKTDM